MEPNEILELFEWFEERRGELRISMLVYDGNLQVRIAAHLPRVDSVISGCGFEKVYAANPLLVQAGVIKELKRRVEG
jgi:hypothetical protein